MVLGMLRSVAGWKADKYRFDVTVHNAYNVLPGTKALQVVWKRGNKHAQTKVRDPIKPAPRVPNRETPAKMLKSRGLPPAARPHRPSPASVRPDRSLTSHPPRAQTQTTRSQRGEAQWEEQLSLACTMFVNPKSGTYEPKPALFVLRELDVDGTGAGRTYAEATVDLLEFAMKPGAAIRRTLPLTRGATQLSTHLIFTIRASPLTEGVALSDVSSEVSVADLADVAEAPDDADAADDGEDGRTRPYRAHGEAAGARVEPDGPRNTKEEDPIARDEDERPRGGARTMEEGMRALQTALVPSDREDENAPARMGREIAPAGRPRAATLQPQSGRYAPPVLYDDEVFRDAGYTVGLTKARDPLLDATAGGAFDGLVPGIDHLRLIVGRTCKINVRANDAFGNARSTGGDAVEGLLLGPLGEEGEVKVRDHGDGTYGLEFVCTSQGVWRLRLRFNGRASASEHELVVSYGPLVAGDLSVKPLKPPFVCGAYTDVVVEVAEPELGRVMTGAEAFSVRVVSPSAMSMSVPLELAPGSTRAVATVCWPEVGAHVLSVTLDGVNLPRSPMNVDVAPEEICLAACQIQGAGTHRAVAGERASFVVEAHDARGNRLVSGEAPFAVIVRTLRGGANPGGGGGGGAVSGEKREEDVTRGQILDYGNGAYEASYVVRTAGPYEVALVLMGEELVMKGTCEPGPAVVPGCVLLGDAVLDLEVGAKGVFTIERRDAYGNVAPSRQGQVKLRCVADGPGDVDAHVVDCAEGRSEVFAVAKVAGRYFITVVGGDDQVPVPGSPFELVAYPGAAAATASVTSVYGAQLASPDADVLAAVAGDEITLTVSPRDKFGNKTVFGPGARVRVSAVVDGDERLEFEDRGGPRAEATLRGALTAAGSYLLRATIGDEPLAGYPRILQIVPGATDPRRCVLFGDAIAGVDCGAQSSLTMHAADRFGNLRATGGDVVDLSMLAPDGKTVVAASVTDHADGTYGAAFKLDQAGAWGLQLIVNGRGGRTDVAEVTANFGPCRAQDCTFAGFGMDGLEGVTTLSSSQIRVFPIAYESANRRMSGKESLSVRVLTPSGGISAVDLRFDRGQYFGTYRWTQPGLHTVSVSLEQEAVVGSPFTVEALAALPEIRELENMSVGDINAILVKMTPDASSQALASLPPEQAAEALAGHSGAAAARMMNGMFPSATAQVLSGMPAAAAAAAVGAMSEEKVADVLGAMAPADGAELMAATSPEETAAKADVFASALGRMSDEESAAALRAMAAASAEAGSADGVAAVMSKMPPAAVADALASMSPEDNVRLVGAMGADEAAAAIGAMDDARKGEVLSAMGAKELAGLTDGLGAAYEDDKRLPAAERQKTRDAAAERAKQLAPALASVPPAKLADSLKDADPSQIAGTLNALVHEGKAASNLLRAMPKAAQKRAAARMLEACPEGTAGAILGDFTGDECAALMAGLSPDEHAEALAELCRENPKAACAALGAMNPEEASRAMSLVVATANNGTGRARLSDASRANLFKCCPPDVLKGIQPATALGSMCASTMSASEAAAVLGKLEPNAAAACLEGMSGEEVRQVLEASAGNGNRDTPLVAAMVPYMASLDAAGAAAMIEALPPDMAVGVMMNTPDDRAREVLAHTKNRSLKERVANRATMALEACDVDLRGENGANFRAVAGERFTFKVISRESGGTRINHGGAHLTAIIHPPGTGKSRKVTGHATTDQCQVLDLGNGVYEVTGVSNAAGKCAVALQSGSQQRDVAVFVEAAEPMVAATTFDRSGLDQWRAGEPGVLKLILRDRYNNEVRPSGALFTFEGRASGPGGVAVEQRASLDENGVLFEFKSTVAGIYKIGVVCVDTGEILPGLPIDATLSAGKISHVGCTALLQTITGASKGPGASASAFGVAVAMAGEEITALVDARDRFGNATAWSGESATVVAHGPADDPVDRSFDVVDVRGGRAGLRGVLPRAGSYTVAVCVDDIPCACSPLVLHVYPGPCETSRATIRGDALSGVLRGAPATVVVQTEDKFGNNCHGGGDQVDLVLQGPTGSRASAVDVVDHGDGSYGCAFVAPMAGRWIVQAVVNGRVAKESTQEVIATYGPLRANDCVLRAGPGMGERVTCGSTRDVYLQALEYDSTGRGMSGQEAVSVHLVTPSGASHTLTAGFAERGSRYRAAVRWWEIGRHEIVATINGEPVVGSPLVVEVDAQEVSLPMCRLSGAGLAGAVAGERAMILVEARDSRGNRLFQGGAVIGVAVRVGGETLRGRVHDCGDGTYEASYVVEKAGPFEVSLFLGTEATTFRATCEAGRVDYTRCRVDGALHNRWIAGTPLAMTVTRMDRFGNRVPRREGLASLAGHGTGPGDVTCETLELGNGSCELRYTASVAGVYSLGVFVDEEPVAFVDTEERSEPLGGDRRGEAGSATNLGSSLAPGVKNLEKQSGIARMEPLRIGGVFGGRTMFPLPGGVFDLTLESGVAEPTMCDVAVVGAGKQGDTWVVAAGDEILVKVIARDRFGNQTHWNDGQSVGVEARGPEYIAFSVTGAAGVKADYLARMVRAGTFELRVMVDSLAVCWRAVQVVAGPTFAPRCKISMEGLQGLRTGDTCRLTLKAADQYGNLRLDGDDVVQLALEGPGGSFAARAVSVVDHHDGTYALEFITPVAGRWNLGCRVNGKPCVEGGVSFVVAFGTLTAEEAVVRLSPTAEETGGVYECGQTAELIIAGQNFESSGRLMTGLEAVTVRLLHPSGAQEALPVVLAKDMTHYAAPIRWLHPGDHAVSVLLDGVQVAGTPLRARAEGMEVSLSSCTFVGDGRERCVAGERATFKMEAKDYSGNRIHRGGAPLLIETRVPGEDPAPGDVIDVGDGTYELSYVVEKAGAMEVAVILAKQSPTVRALPVTCLAGPMEPSECRVDAGKLTLHWPAGEPGVCRVTRRDRFGNQTRDAGVLNRLAAEVTGPGPCDCEAVELGDGACELRLRAAAAGSYDVSVIALAVPGPGGPVEVGHFQAEVTSGPTFPSACVARMALLVNDPSDPSGGGLVEESLGEPDGDITLPATVMAGDRILVYVLPRDSSGNKTRWSGGERIAVSARGPAETTFEPLDAVGAFAATLQTSGAYSVAALVGDCSAAGWPRVLQVVAGPCDPDRCVLSGDALGACATGRKLSLQLQASDRYGNPRSMGGDMVEVFAKPRDSRGAGRVEAEVVDNADGTYAVALVLEEAAIHDVHVNVNGLSDSRSRYFLAPTLAPLTAADCTVRGVAGDEPSLCDVTALYVQPANPIREMSGREAVVVTVHTPSGLAFNNPVKFEKGNRRFASPVYWVEPGAHSVAVTLSGKALPGCPFLVEVRDPHGEELDAMGKPGQSSSKTGKSGKGGKGDGANDGDDDTAAGASAAAAAAAAAAADPDVDKRFAFGGGGLKPSKAASERAARSLAGMSSKVAAQAISDMRPAAAGAVMASMEVSAAVAAAEAMEPAVAAAAMCSMEVHEAIACVVEMPKESRKAILESMTPEQLGALLSAMTPEDASDIIRILDTKWSILAVDNMVPGPAAAAMQMLPEERLVEVLVGVSPKKAGAPLLEALEETEPGHRLAADAMTTLTNRHADRAAAHIAAMVDTAMAGTDRGVPGSGYAVARLFADLPLTCQGLTIIRVTAKQAAYLMSWLGADGAAKAAKAAAKAAGANGAGFCAAAAEELDAMGFAADNEKAGTGAAGKSGRGAAASLLAAMAKDDADAASRTLAALDSSLAAAALSQLGPRAAADLASGVSDPTVGAALLEQMPVEKRAAMMVRMEPAAAAAAAGAMHPEAAAEAMEAVQASGGDSGGGEAAKRLGAMVSQMDPFAAAQACSAMSKEAAAAMTASLPPDRAGAIIASGGIPAEDAGSMLDALPLDAADKVMAALPPDVADKAAAHVTSDEIRERAAARAVVHLPSSTLEGDGAERCVAGVEASFRLQSANPGGGRIGRGGAIISCVMHALEPAGAHGAELDDADDDTAGESGATKMSTRKRLGFPFPIDARCEDLGDGTYEFYYELQRAGEYQCSLQTAGHEHCFYVLCVPCALDPNSCTVEEPASVDGWTAGTPLEVRVNCHDMFGNPIKPPGPGAHDPSASPLVIVADGEGPGMVEAEVVADESDPDATWQIARFRATECGEYELRVFATETQRQWWGGMPRNNLPGAPLRLTLTPAPADPARSRVKLGGLKERPGGMLVGMAGREASVTVTAVDKYDNPAEFGDLKLRVDAMGPADVTFRKESDDGSSCRFFGSPERSGSYTLRVTLAGRAVAGFPRNLQVVAARTDPTRCVVRGDALEGIRVGETAKASVVAHDAFGNSCLEGGDQVMVRLLGPAGSVDADVVDYGDGTYGLSFSVPRAGTWRAHLAVNGGENPDPVAEFVASQGVLAANQVALRIVHAQSGDDDFTPRGNLGNSKGAVSQAPRAGTETIVHVQALDHDVSGREVSGAEPVCLRMLSPSGVSANVPLRLAKDGARFHARVRWPEVGRHVLVASINGDAVVGSPSHVDVVAADVHLPSCVVTGPGASGCVAGERTRFVVEARDSRGNRLCAGGASLTLRVQTPGSEPTRGSVLDQGDGTYAASYAVDKAGPYVLVLSAGAGGSRLALEGTCAPGATDVTRCVVDASGLAQLTAGSRGVVKIVRRDKFGNAVEAGPDVLPFRVEATGVGPVSVETVESGDGGCEIRFEAKAAGRYALHAWSGYKRDAVAGSPFDVVVLPGQASASSCVAQLVGTTHAVGGPGVVAAVAGETLSVRMQARDRFGNATAWKRWQTLSVAASGPQDVVFKERLEDTGADTDGGVRQLSDASASGRGVFSAVLHRAGAYVVWCTVGGQAVVGWPRVIQVVPNTAAADASEWRAEAETMALTSEIASNAPFDRTGGLATRDTRRGAIGEAARARAEADSLRARLAKYEEAAAVVMEAAEATGITLKQHARAAAMAKEARIREVGDVVVSDDVGDGATGGGASEAFDARATRQLGIRELTAEEENDWTAGTPRQRGGRRSGGAMTRAPDADRL